MFKCGIDIGGTYIKIGFFKEDKDFTFKITTPKELELFIPAIKEAILKYHKLNEIEKYVVSIPGICEQGEIVYAPNTNIEGLKIEKELKKALENDNILIENDANIQALVEAKLANLEDLVLLTLGTGCGGGIILDGKLINKCGYAGEVGHIKVHFGKNARRCGCGKFGCAEAYVSAKNMVIEYNEKTGKEVSAKRLFVLAKNGDSLAKKVVNDCARYLAILIADIVSVVGIKNVRIAGGLSNAGSDLIEPIRKYYPQYSVRNMENISIDTAILKGKSGVVAAKYL